MEFNYSSQQVKLQGEKEVNNEEIQLHQLRRLVAHDEIASCYQLVALITETLPQSSTSDGIPRQIQELLEEFKHVFELPKQLPPQRNNDHRIHLQSESTTIDVRPYRYPHCQKSEIEKLVEEMLELKKKDGTWRFCVDYRALNQAIVPHRFPIPIVDEILDELFETTIFSKMDLRAGYHKIRIAPQDIHKTAFRTHQGHYEFVVMPFGLSNAPAIFQSTMNEMLKPYLRKFVTVFFDDILVYSKSMGMTVCVSFVVLGVWPKFELPHHCCALALTDTDPQCIDLLCRGYFAHRMMFPNVCILVDVLTKNGFST
ncbi:RNA-directed DNA polymerase like [Apostasia shenzhenica]|uniref:RNA-directed DNA polymerase like n=1 Tax=Apostasia shenzhenica TaxID=1088818 RepID=A0A2H9ZUF2_9ASPA|nr:RNA-directed DNA polymerase like [Apostasia shenzhenica]